MYFSKKNKNHIFNLLEDLVLKETGVSINDISEYKDLYRFKYPLIFQRSNSDNLAELNKDLIDEIGNLIINDINSKYIKSDNQQSESIKEPLIIEKEKIKEETIKEITFNSYERIEDNDNRYSYTLKIPLIKRLSLQKIIIPVEENLLFLNPIININLSNLSNELDIFCLFENQIKNNDQLFNVYKPTKQQFFNINNDTLKIEIRNNLKNKILENSDKLQVNKYKNIIIEDKNYLCLQLKEKNNLNKSISIFHQNKNLKSLLIDEIHDNNLLLLNQTIEPNLQLSILDLSLQNTIFFEYY